MQANFQDASMVGVQLTDSDLSDSNFLHADLRISDVRMANLACADFGRANLSFSDCRSANFSDASLNDCNLRFANCRSANFTTARTMSQLQVDSMFGDSSTKLPPALVRPEHWADGDFVHTSWRDIAYDKWVETSAPLVKSYEGQALPSS